jgi:diketogulonate reductase-like aldo/keto reductase
MGPPVDDERLYRVVDALEAVAADTGKSVPQIAIAWLTRPIVSSVIIGARNEMQFSDNLGAVGWSLSTEQIATLDGASKVRVASRCYPYRTQEGFARLNPAPETTLLRRVEMRRRVQNVRRRRLS